MSCWIWGLGYMVIGVRLVLGLLIGVINLVVVVVDYFIICKFVLMLY